MTHSPEYWRALAKSLRSRAEYTYRPNMQDRYDAALRQAEGYDRMAELAERGGKPKEAEENCDNCKFYRRQACHRYPMGREKYEGRFEFPRTNWADWCGEWSAKP